MVKRVGDSVLSAFLILWTSNVANSQNWYDGLSHDEVYHHGAAIIGGTKFYASFCDELVPNGEVIDSVLMDIETHSFFGINSIFYNLSAQYRGEIEERVRLMVEGQASIPYSKNQFCGEIKNQFTDVGNDLTTPNTLMVISKNQPIILSDQKNWFYGRLAGDVYEDGAAHLGYAIAYAETCSKLELDSHVADNFVADIEVYSGQEIRQEFYANLAMAHDLRLVILSFFDEEIVCNKARENYSSEDGVWSYPNFLKEAINPALSLNNLTDRWFGELLNGPPDYARALHYALVQLISAKCDSLSLDIENAAYIELAKFEDSNVSDFTSHFLAELQNWHPHEICLIGEEVFMADTGPYPRVFVASQ